MASAILDLFGKPNEVDVYAASTPGSLRVNGQADWHIRSETVLMCSGLGSKSDVRERGV